MTPTDIGPYWRRDTDNAPRLVLVTRDATGELTWTWPPDCWLHATRQFLVEDDGQWLGPVAPWEGT